MIHFNGKYINGNSAIIIDPKENEELHDFFSPSGSISLSELQGYGNFHLISNGFPHWFLMSGIYPISSVNYHFDFGFFGKMKKARFAYYIDVKNGTTNLNTMLTEYSLSQGLSVSGYISNDPILKIEEDPTSLKFCLPEVFDFSDSTYFQLLIKEPLNGVGSRKLEHITYETYYILKDITNRNIAQVKIDNNPLRIKNDMVEYAANFWLYKPTNLLVFLKRLVNSELLAYMVRHCWYY